MRRKKSDCERMGHSPEKGLAAAYTGRVELKVYPSDKPFGALLLAHGAGAGQMSSFMVRVATGLAERGLSTATFDFAYMAAGRKVPDRAPALESAWRDAMATGRSRFGGLPLYIGGKSMGGRIASHVAAQGEPARWPGSSSLVIRCIRPAALNSAATRTFRR